MMEKTLPEVCIIQYGFPFDSSKFCSAEGVPLVRIRDVVRGCSETYTTEIAGENYIVNDGDLLIGMDGEFNIAYWKGGRAYLNQRVCRLIPREDVDRDYIFYYMPQALKAIEDATPFVTVKHLSAKQLSKILIPLPDMSEQQRISAVLRSVDRVIAMRKKELDELNNLVKSRFIELFGDCLSNPKGWKTKCLEDIADVGSSKRVFVEELREDGIPFFRGTEVGALAEGKSVSPELFITEEHYAALCSATGAPQIGDLLMPSICPDGRIWVVNTDKPFYFKDGRVLWIHAIDASFNSTFLLYSLKDRIMTDYSSIASGTTFAELKIFSLKKCKVFAAPLTLQNEFAAFVEQTDKSKLAVQKGLQELEILKKSLMQQYFG